jgi:hypothetical protein
MIEMNPIGDIADNIITLLERKNARMNVNVLEELSNVDHKRFKVVFDFLVQFRFMEYNPGNQTVKLSNSLLFSQLNQELSSEQKFGN